MKKFYSLFSILVVISFFIGFSIKPNLSQAQAEVPEGVPDDIDIEQCAEDLTEYMNTVVDGVGTLNNAKLLSPSFNLTSHFEVAIYDFMVEFGAKFDRLDAMSGNAYTRYNQPDAATACGPANGIITAYEWYECWYGWKAKFGGKQMIFTEYGDFATHDLSLDYYDQSHIDSMKVEFQKVVSGGANDGALYFAPFLSNPEFEFHHITNDHLKEIVGGNGSRGGVNAANQLDSGGGFVKLVQEVGAGFKYTLEIITGPDGSVASYINNVPSDMMPIIRLCWGSTCGFKDPEVLVEYIKQLDRDTTRDFFIIAGPNEPLTDPWVSEACGAAADRVWEWEKAHCGDSLDPEFHSLRPYPGNPCPAGPTPVQKVLMCGNQITASETFKIYSSETKEGGVDLGSCQELPSTQRTITFEGPGGVEISETFDEGRWLCEDINVQSKASLTIDLTESELPVLGNTEDVPNAASSTNSLSFANRMNNYVSWYLQGVFQTAEEEYASPSDPIGVRNMIDFAGPIQKLLPHEVLRNQWAGEETIKLGDSHNQIVVCKQGLPEACYIEDSQNRVRKSSARSNPYSIDASYIPLSTTEDEIGQIRLMTEGASQPGIEEGNEVGYLATDLDHLGDLPTNPYVYPEDANTGVKTHDILFFPHTRESIQLADILQRTYVPEDALVKDLTKKSSRNSTNEEYTKYLNSQARRKGWIISDDRMPPVEKPEFEYNGEFCQLVDAYEGPGDNLYGWLDDNHYAQEGVSLDEPDPAIEPGWEGEAYEAKNLNAEVIYEGLAECEFTETVDGGCYKGCRTAQRSDCLTIPACEDTGGSWSTNNSGADICDASTVFCRWTELENSVSTCVDQCNNVPACEVTGMASAYVEMETPWVEEVFKRLINGGMSVYRRIFPRLAANNRNLPTDQQIVVPGPEKIVNIPAKTTAEYSMEHIDGNQEYMDGSGEALGGNPIDGTSTGELYFPLIGSVHEYFFDDIQCALRPAGIGCPQTQDVAKGATVDCDIYTAEELVAILPPVESSCTGSCSGYGFSQSPTMKKIFESAASYYKVPVSVLLGVFYNEGGLNDAWTEEKVLAASGPGCMVDDCGGNVSSTGAKGPWQFVDSTWNALSGAVTEAGVNDGRNPNKCNLVDSTFAAAKTLAQGKGGANSYPAPWDKFPSCAGGIRYNTGEGVSRSCNWDRSDVVTAARQYLGYCEEPDRSSQPKKPRQACINNPATCYQRNVLNFCGAF